VKRGDDDKRGRAADPRRRKHKLLHWFGDGTTAPCVHCGVKLTWDTLEQDRIIPGGPYRMSNLQPSCGPCNRRRGDSPITPFPGLTAGEVS
jgi:5-methylcytosine-specific restriction endonuclease McrA